ncbi:MAG: DUF3417 domain-containing protein, partial [Solimonas sp.]
ELAREYAAWKRGLRARWGGVTLRAPTLPPVLAQGETLSLSVVAGLNGLQAKDVVVECLIGDERDGRFEAQKTVTLAPQGEDGGGVRFGADIEPLPGLQKLRLRIRPQHPAMSHPFELGAAIWA